ncbi:MAG: transcriptional repressor [Bacteroidales bacterium]|nr:transcriptional repressor [Bacteroidales bacterium]
MITDNKNAVAARAALVQYLSRRRLRKTPERFAILDRVMTMDRHFVADDLYGRMETDGYHVSRTTVYNTLELLVSAGILRRHNFGRTKAHYELITGLGSNHHHLVCTVCGKIKEVKDSRLASMLDNRTFPAFSPEWYDLCVYGVCSTCARKTRKSRQKLN